MTRIVAFDEGHVAGASLLLARRHADHRLVEPLLPQVEDFEEQVREELVEATGATALDGDEVVGYLVGKRREDPIGPHVWSGTAGHAVGAPVLARDLYAGAAARWVAAGLTRHFIFAPAIRALVEPWFRLSFGASATLAIRDTAPGPATRPPASGLVVRRSTRADLPDVVRLAGVLESTLVDAPSFSGFPAHTDPERAAAWADIWEQQEYVHFVADLGGRVVGHTLLHRRPADLRIPPRSIDLAIAATDPEVRGTGAGVAMSDHVLAWAREQGLTAVTTDWRMTNLAASRFWPRRGFREAFLRLYRSVP